MTTPTSTQHPYPSAQTILRNDTHPIKVGILEISTRACKLLIADIRELQQGFTWDGFRSEGNLTNLGLQVDNSGSIPWESFATAVLPHLQRHLERLRNHQPLQQSIMSTPLPAFGSYTTILGKVGSQTGNLKIVMNCWIWRLHTDHIC